MHKVATSLKAMYFNTNIYDQMNDMEAVGHKPEYNEIVRRFAPALVSKERTVLADLSEMADNGWNLIIDGVKLYMPSMTTVESQFNSRQAGWYVEITPEMKEAYEKQLYCKRCGTQYNSLGLRTKEDVVIAAPMYDGYFWCPHCLEDHKLQKQDFASIQLRKFCERNQHKSTGYSLNIPYDDLMRRNVNNRMDGIYMNNAEEMKAEGENLTRIKTNLLVREWCHERGLDFKNVTTADDGAYHWFAADPINDGVAEVMHEKLVYFPAKYRLHLHNQRVINDPREQYAEV